MSEIVDTRVPASVSGNGEFEVAESESVFVSLPGEDSPGIFSCTDDNMHLAYGRLAVNRKHGHTLSGQEAFKQYGVRPEWWDAALDFAASWHMSNNGVSPRMVALSNEFSYKRNVIAAVRYGGRFSDSDSVLSAAARKLLTKLTGIWSNPRLLAKYMKLLQDSVDEREAIDKQQKKKQQQQQQQQNQEEGDGSESHSFRFDPVLVERYSEEGEWAEMFINRPPLVNPHPPAVAALRRRPGFSGPFRYALRAAIPMMDGRAFGERKKVPGGTVLFDCSGSMKMGPSEITALLDNRPAATVAVYGLHDEKSRQRGDNGGNLYIVARNGRIVDYALFSIVGGNNLIDGPALEWLAKQRRPRFWVSDALVTGKQGYHAVNLALEASQICRAGGIVRYATPGAFIKSARRARR